MFYLSVKRRKILKLTVTLFATYLLFESSKYLFHGFTKTRDTCNEDNKCSCDDKSLLVEWKGSLRDQEKDNLNQSQYLKNWNNIGSADIPLKLCSVVPKTLGKYINLRTIC